MKRIISVFLIIATLVAMLPAGAVLAAGETAESYEFKFTAAAIGQTKNTNIYNGTKLAGYGFGNVKSGNAWKLVQVLGGASKEAVQANKSNFVIFAAQSASEVAEANANAVVFQLYLGDYGAETPASAGTYVPTLTNPQDGGQNHYGITDLYLVSSAAVSKNGWKINSLDEVQKIISNAAKLGSGNESAMADVIHLSSENGCKAATSTKNDFKKTAEKVMLNGGYYYLIATVSKPTDWKKAPQQLIPTTKSSARSQILSLQK